MAAADMYEEEEENLCNPLNFKDELQPEYYIHMCIYNPAFFNSDF